MWCGREDLNLHGLAATSPSSLRVYQFHHVRLRPDSHRDYGVTMSADKIKNFNFLWRLLEFFWFLVSWCSLLRNKV